MFQKLGNNLNKSQKHFKGFGLIQNDFITELKENTFSDITFDAIVFNICGNLKTIHRNAFTTTNLITKVQTQNYLPLIYLKF